MFLFLEKFIYYNVILRNMVLISKISKGSKMDQIYIPKNRDSCFSVGSYVKIELIEEKEEIKLFFYNIVKLESVKIDIIKKIFENIKNVNNSIIGGSFLEDGFEFKDIDVLIINENKLNLKKIEKEIFDNLGVKVHFILIDNKSLLNSLSSDPLYSLMLDKYVAKKRIIYNVKRRINYRLLDLHLIESKRIIDEFDFLDGIKKYKLVRNLVAIKLFIENKKISNFGINKEIVKCFKVSIDDIKKNLVDKDFLKKFKKEYEKISKKVIENGAKQK